jgi:hypothetical protein
MQKPVSKIEKEVEILCNKLTQQTKSMETD